MIILDRDDVHGVTVAISDSLLRLSIGLEAEQDLIAGLQAGLASC